MSKRTVILIQGPEFSKEKREQNLKKQISIMEGVEIIVTGIDDKFIDIEKFFKDNQKYNFFSIGNSTKSITKDEIKNLLQQAAEDNTNNEEAPLILLSMHGATANTPNSTIKPHCLAINLEEEPISVLYTGELFRLVNDYIKTPVELLFFSCQSGSAIKCVHLLPKNSKLVTFSNNENPISVASIEGFKYLNEHYIQDFSIKSFLEATTLNGTPDTLNSTISISGKGIA